jgi:excisionase family DNA binding protein
MNKSTWDTLPDRVDEIIKKIDLLISDKVSQNKEADYFLSIEDLRDYLPENPARQTIYGWIFERKIPFEKHGKRLYFRKSEVDKWLANGRPISK